MSTDLYGVRVLDVAPGELRARFRVFVVYYDVHDRSHAPLPDGDVGFFFRVLWEAAHDRPIAQWHALQAVTLDDFLDVEWGEANSHLYVRRVDRVAARNHPVEDGAWEDLHDFYYERDGAWANEDRLVQADYDVRVTDPRWLESLTPGDSWGTTVYVTDADQVTEPGAPAVVDLRGAARRLDPFPGACTDAATPSDLAFSDDGEYLAVTNQACDLVVYRTAGWTEHVRVRERADLPWGQDIQWVPGTHLLTRRPPEPEDDEPPTTAYDVDAGRLVELADAPDGPAGAWMAEAVRPDGAYLATYGGDGFGRPQRIELRRTADGLVLMRCRPRGHRYVSRLAWSPDGRMLAAALIEDHNGYGGELHLFEPGTPVTVPEAGEPSEELLRERLGRSSDPVDIMALTGMLAARADGATAKARVWRGAAERLEDWATPPPAAAGAYRRAIEHGTAADAVSDGVSLSRLLYREGDLDGAVDAARDAHRLAESLDGGDGDLDLRFSAAVRVADMARTRGARGDLDEAEAAYGVCLRLKPGEAWSLLGLGWVAAERGDHDAARPYLLRAVDAGHAHAEGYAAMLLGGSAKAARDVGEALRWYERAMIHDRHAPLATGHLGELCYQVGDRDGARRWYERMLEVTDLPDLVAEACFRLGEMAAADGDTARARTNLERAAGTEDATFAEQARRLLGTLAPN
jgi:tetratricopeptide (TPR) repeat protein